MSQAAMTDGNMDWRYTTSFFQIMAHFTPVFYGRCYTGGVPPPHKKALSPHGGVWVPKATAQRPKAAAQRPKATAQRPQGTARRRRSHVMHRSGS